MKNKSSFIAAGVVFLALVLGSCGANKKLLKENEDLTSNLTATRAKVAELEGRLSDKDREIQDLEAQIKSKNEELLALQGELSESRAKAQEFEVQITSKEEEISSLRGSMKTRGDTQTKELSSLRSDLETAKRRNDQLETQITGLEKSIGEQNTDLRSLQAERDTLQRRIDDLNAQLAAISLEKDSIAQKNAELEKEITSLRSTTESDKEKMESTYEGLLASLRDEVDKKTVEVQRYKNALTINILDHIFFDSGKADIKKEGFSVLDRIASIVKDLPEKIIKIEGHTDDVPIGAKLKAKYPTNWELGAARASAVARYFTGKHNIDPSRIVTISYAFYRPLVPNTSAENRAKNRRIEIVLGDRELYQLIEIDRGLAVE